MGGVDEKEVKTVIQCGPSSLPSQPPPPLPTRSLSLSLYIDLSISRTNVPEQARGLFAQQQEPFTMTDAEQQAVHANLCVQWHP